MAWFLSGDFEPPRPLAGEEQVPVFFFAT